MAHTAGGNSRADDTRSRQNAHEAPRLLVGQSQSRARADPRVRPCQPEGVQPPRWRRLRLHRRYGIDPGFKESATGRAASLRIQELAGARAAKAVARRSDPAARSGCAISIGGCDGYRAARARQGLTAEARSADFDVLPESKPVGNLLHRETRCLITPGGSRMTRAVDHHIIELDVVRTGEIRLGLCRLLQQLHAHG